MNLKSKVVVVTGSTRNIGKAIALKFARHGAKVVVNSRSDVQGGRLVTEEIESLGGTSIFIQADVSNPQHVDQLFAKALSSFGTVDVLINNAGGVVPKSFLELTKDDWVEAFNDNVITTALCSVRAAKIMFERGSGTIINTASIRGLPHGGREGAIPYSACKAAVINFTKTLAKALAPKITVNAVAPGYTLTSSYDGVSQEMKDAFIASTLIKRWLSVDEVADAFLYLAQADGITGEVLVIDGGCTV